jgi:hypothetical protein
MSHRIMVSVVQVVNSKQWNRNRCRRKEGIGKDKRGRRGDRREEGKLCEYRST